MENSSTASTLGTFIILPPQITDLRASCETKVRKLGEIGQFKQNHSFN